MPARFRTHAQVGALITAAAWVAVATAQTPPKTFQDAQNAAQTADKPFKRPTLVPGDAAPALSINKWVRGEPVSKFEPGKIYVVEFWAVWCGPCIQNIPHLTKLQEKYTNRVTFIGATAEDQRNTLEAVEEFVAARGPGSTAPGGHMGYSVAFDDARKTYAAYMQAAGRQGIPCAYIVDQQGRLAWIGHPAEIDEPLAQVVDGVYDLSKHSETYLRRLELDHRGRAHSTAYRSAMREERYDDALTSCERLLAIDPDHFRTFAFNKFMILLANKNQPEAAYLWGRSAIEGPLKDDADTLGRMAWGIMDAEQVKIRDYDVARLAAERAVETSKRTDPLALATLAKVHAVKGDTNAALKLLDEAANVAGDERIKALIEEQKAELTANAPAPGGG